MVLLLLLLLHGFVSHLLLIGKAMELLHRSDPLSVDLRSGSAVVHRSVWILMMHSHLRMLTHSFSLRSRWTSRWLPISILRSSSRSHHARHQAWIASSHRRSHSTVSSSRRLSAEALASDQVLDSESKDYLAVEGGGAP